MRRRRGHARGMRSQGPPSKGEVRGFAGRDNGNRKRDRGGAPRGRERAWEREGEGGSGPWGWRQKRLEEATSTAGRLAGASHQGDAI